MLEMSKYRFVIISVFNSRLSDFHITNAFLKIIRDFKRVFFHTFLNNESNNKVLSNIW